MVPRIRQDLGTRSHSSSGKATRRFRENRRQVGHPVTSGAVIAEDEVLGEKKPTTVANPVGVPVPENFPFSVPSAKALANVSPAKESDLNENGWKPNEGEA